MNNYNVLQPNIVGFRSIVADAQQQSELGTLFTNLFGQVITGVTDRGVQAGTDFLRDQGLYTTGPDGSLGPQQPVPQQSDPQQAGQTDSGGNMGLGMAVPALLIGGVVLFLVLR